MWTSDELATGQLSPAKIESRDGEVIFLADDSCYETHAECSTFLNEVYLVFYLLIVLSSESIYRNQLVERVRRIAVARQRNICAVLDGAALAGVAAGIVYGPEIPSSSVSIISPGVGDSVELERRVIAIVLILINGKKYND